MSDADSKNVCSLCFETLTSGTLAAAAQLDKNGFGKSCMNCKESTTCTFTRGGNKRTQGYFRLYIDLSQPLPGTLSSVDLPNDATMEDAIARIRDLQQLAGATQRHLDAVTAEAASLQDELRSREAELTAVEAQLRASEVALFAANEASKQSKRDAMKFEAKFLETQKALQSIERTNAVDNYLKDLDLTELRRRMRGRKSDDTLESVVEGLHKASVYQKRQYDELHAKFMKAAGDLRISEEKNVKLVKHVDAITLRLNVLNTNNVKTTQRAIALEQQLLRLGVTPKVDHDRESSKAVTSSKRDMDTSVIIQEGRVPALPARTQTQQTPTAVPSTYEIIDVDTDDEDVGMHVAPPRALHARNGTPAVKNPFQVSTTATAHHESPDIDFSLIPPKPDTAARKRVHTAATDTGTYIKTGYDSTGAIRAVSLSALTPAQTLINSPKLPLPAAAASAAKKKAKLAAQPSLENYFGKK